MSPAVVASLSMSAKIPSLTSTSTATPDSDKALDTAPSSPPLLSSPFPSITTTRDRRAYEHDRQKAKKSADRAVTKARKEGWLPRLYKAQPLSHSSSAGGGGRSTPEMKLSDDDLVNVEGCNLFENLKHEFSHSSNEWNKAETPQTEVKLADLITKAKARKSKAGDFEVIPHIRSVIVLDDMASHDIPFDDTWECIQREDSTDEEDYAPVNAAKLKPEGLSYAHAVLSTVK